jgi:hypothetical protein
LLKAGKNETDKTDERTKNIFDAIDFLEKIRGCSKS